MNYFKAGKLLEVYCDLNCDIICEIFKYSGNIKINCKDEFIINQIGLVNYIPDENYYSPYFKCIICNKSYFNNCREFHVNTKSHSEAYNAIERGYHINLNKFTF